MTELAVECVVIAAERLRLDDLQSLSQSCRALRAAVTALPPAVWRASARITVPHYHPLLKTAAHGDSIPAACTRLWASYSGLVRGSISGRRVSSVGAAEFALLQPDLVRARVPVPVPVSLSLCVPVLLCVCVCACARARAMLSTLCLNQCRCRWAAC